MKKTAVLLLAIATLFALYACNVAPMPEVESTDTGSEAPTESRFEEKTEDICPIPQVEFSGEYAETLTYIRDMIDLTFQFDFPVQRDQCDQSFGFLHG